MKPSNLNHEFSLNLVFKVDTPWDSLNIFETVTINQDKMWRVRDELDMLLGDCLGETMEMVLSEDISVLNE